ncbi:MAG: hypothetical protein HYS88_01605 [Candidatus Colwellbacteria bacterium]|nr:hypothetical protein [Candidatus Colwellbacteria bacterium]
MSEKPRSNLRGEPRSPRYRVSEGRRAGKLKFFLFLFLLGLIAAGVVYLIWFTPAFQIQVIEVNGGTPAQQEILKQKTNNNLLFWKPPINQSDYPHIAKLEVKRNFFERKIVVNLEERQKEIIWCLEKTQQCLWVDGTGFAFTSAPFTTGTLVEVKVVRDYSERVVKIGENTLPPKNFANLASAMNALRELNLPVEEVKIENIDYKEVTADLSSGPDIYFSLLFDPGFARDVVEKLKASGEWNTLRYLDLRVENRAYYSP